MSFLRTCYRINAANQALGLLTGSGSRNTTVNVDTKAISQSIADMAHAQEASFVASMTTKNEMENWTPVKGKLGDDFNFENTERIDEYNATYGFVSFRGGQPFLPAVFYWVYAQDANKLCDVTQHKVILMSPTSAGLYDRSRTSQMKWWTPERVACIPRTPPASALPQPTPVADPDKVELMKVMKEIALTLKYIMNNQDKKALSDTIDGMLAVMPAKKAADAAATATAAADPSGLPYPNITIPGRKTCGITSCVLKPVVPPDAASDHKQ